MFAPFASPMVPTKYTQKPSQNWSFNPADQQRTLVSEQLAFSEIPNPARPGPPSRAVFAGWGEERVRDPYSRESSSFGENAKEFPERLHNPLRQILIFLLSQQLMPCTLNLHQTVLARQQCQCRLHLF